ncbi:hypothetical protein PTKIN_Ptkin15bG0137700 [Pterospermum kingtungense]
MNLDSLSVWPESAGKVANQAIQLGVCFAIVEVSMAAHSVVVAIAPVGVPESVESATGDLVLAAALVEVPKSIEGVPESVEGATGDLVLAAALVEVPKSIEGVSESVEGAAGGLFRAAASVRVAKSVDGAAGGSILAAALVEVLESVKGATGGLFWAAAPVGVPKSVEGAVGGLVLVAALVGVSKSVEVLATASIGVLESVEDALLRLEFQNQSKGVPESVEGATDGLVLAVAPVGIPKSVEVGVPKLVEGAVGGLVLAAAPVGVPESIEGAGFGLKLSYGTRFFHMRIKLPDKDSVGVVTAFYDFYKFYVDDIPIRVFKNNKNIGVEYPSQPMKIEASLWDGDSWATDGGQTKTNWSMAPFRAHFQGFDISGCSTIEQKHSKNCVVDKECFSPKYWWNSEKYWKLDSKQQGQLENVRKEYMNYDYCADRPRYPVPPPECLSNS